MICREASDLSRSRVRRRWSSSAFICRWEEILRSCRRPRDLTVFTMRHTYVRARGETWERGVVVDDRAAPAAGGGEDRAYLRSDGFLPSSPVPPQTIWPAHVVMHPSQAVYFSAGQSVPSAPSWPRWR